MSYKQVHKGKTFPPNSKFPEHCYFEGCTFQATCYFGEGCHFVNCKFTKCCPKKNQNAPSKVVKGIVESSTLESVHLDKETLGVNNKSTGYKVIDESWSRAGVTRGNTEDVCLCYCTPPNPCAGVSIPPKDGGTPPVDKVADCQPCPRNQGFGDSKVTAK